MDRPNDGFEDFREGMAAGHAAARDGNLLYAAGFVIGFLWGAIFGAESTGRNAFEHAA